MDDVQQLFRKAIRLAAEYDLLSGRAFDEQTRAYYRGLARFQTDVAAALRLELSHARPAGDV